MNLAPKNLQHSSTKNDRYLGNFYSISETVKDVLELDEEHPFFRINYKIPLVCLF
jgi:hypothetical protein